MAETKKVNVEDFAESLSQILDDFSDHAIDGAKKAAEEAGEYALQSLRSTSPKKKGKGGGKYRRSWNKDTSIDATGRVNVTVYSKKHYRLTHLLENGHEIAYRSKSTGRIVSTGKRAQAFPHIKPVEEAAIKLFEEKIELYVGGSD